MHSYLLRRPAWALRQVRARCRSGHHTLPELRYANNSLPNVRPKEPELLTAHLGHGSCPTTHPSSRAPGRAPSPAHSPPLPDPRRPPAPSPLGTPARASPAPLPSQSAAPARPKRTRAAPAGPEATELPPAAPDSPRRAHRGRRGTGRAHPAQDGNGWARAEPRRPYPFAAAATVARKEELDALPLPEAAAGVSRDPVRAQLGPPAPPGGRRTQVRRGGSLVPTRASLPRYPPGRHPSGTQPGVILPSTHPSTIPRSTHPGITPSSHTGVPTSAPASPPFAVPKVRAI